MTVHIPTRFLFTFVGAVLGLQLGCGSEHITEPPIPASVTANSSVSLSGIAGFPATPLPSVSVRDQRGAPLGGVSVQFVVTAGGGSTQGGSSVTNSSGIATVSEWKLGPTAGSNTLTANVDGVAPVTFSAIGAAGVAAQLALFEGSNSGIVAQPVTTPPAVRVVDTNGNPVEGVSVTFTTTGGGGIVAGPATQLTNVQGVARISGWTLGNTAGSNTLEASAALAGSPVVFTVAAAPGPAAKLVLTAPPSGTVPSRTVFPVQPVVQVKDAYDNAVPDAGREVTVAIATGGGVLGGHTVVTTANGLASFSDLSIAGLVGTRTLTFMSSGLASSSASVILTHGAATGIAAAMGDRQSGLAGAAVGIAPSVLVIDADGNPVTSEAVVFEISGGGGKLTGATQVTSATGIATVGSWTLGLAGANTLTASSARIGQTVTFTATAEEMKTISAGGAHTCALGTSGRAYCWGNNDLGQLGSTTAASPSGPVVVMGGLVFRSVSAGAAHSCGLTTDFVTYCWGYNAQGQLGDGTHTNQRQPIMVSGGIRFDTVVAGNVQTCALTSGGAAYCWGLNRDGELGNGTKSDAVTPVAVSGGLSFVSLSVGEEYACGVTGAGVAYCWGDNGFWQLGIGDVIRTPRLAPVQVAGGLVFRSIAAGQNHTCGVSDSGAAYCWGFNGAPIPGLEFVGADSGAVGDGTSTSRPTPVAVAGGLQIAQVTVGQFHTCAVAVGGSAYCWGGNARGQVGDGTTISRLSPVPIASGLSFSTISSSYRHTCAMLSGEPRAVCWGVNESGQLGPGTPGDRLRPGPSP